MRTISLFLSIFVAAAPAALAELTGYVVKSADGVLYLDLGKDSGIANRSVYDLATVGEQLKHPVTGETLGAEFAPAGKISIISVEDKYSTASPVGDTKLPAPGTKIRIELSREPAPRASAQTAPPSAASGSKLRDSIDRSPTLPITAVDLSIGDVDGDGRDEIVLAGAREIAVYGSDWKRKCHYEDSSTANRLVSVESEDLDGDGKAEIFAVADNRFFKRLETLVLDCADGKASKRTALPFTVRSFFDGSGLAVLGMQAVDIDGEYLAGPIHRLGFSNGKYGKHGEAVRHKRLDWLYGMGFSLRDESPILLSYSKTQRIRLFFKKGSWSTPQKYGQTSERMKLRAKELRFSPRLVVAQDDAGLSGIYTVKNIPRFFQMAAAFGRYNRAELHHLRWNGLALEETWKANLGGYAAGLAERKDTLLVAVVGANGRSSVWTFSK
jgi:hypothetical protein